MRGSKGDTAASVARMRASSLALGVLLATLNGCFSLRGSSGGGEIDRARGRVIEPADVLVPAGFAIEPVLRGLTFPTGVALDAEGAVHVVEAGYSSGEAFTTARLLRLERDGSV